MTILGDTKVFLMYGTLIETQGYRVSPDEVACTAWEALSIPFGPIGLPGKTGEGGTGVVAQEASDL